MKTCKECGGRFLRHGYRESGKGLVERYKCEDCGRTLSIRNGEVVNGTGKRGPQFPDWRTMGGDQYNLPKARPVSGDQVLREGAVAVCDLERRIQDGSI